MPHCQLPEILFTVLIGTFTVALMILSLREAFLRSRGQ
jgi:hypothetical protein